MSLCRSTTAASTTRCSPVCAMARRSSRSSPGPRTRSTDTCGRVRLRMEGRASVSPIITAGRAITRRADGSSHYGNSSLSTKNGRWCTRQTKDETDPEPNVLCDDRCATTDWRRMELGRPVANIRFRTAMPGGSLSLLGNEAPGTRRRCPINPLYRPIVVSIYDRRP